MVIALIKLGLSSAYHGVRRAAQWRCRTEGLRAKSSLSESSYTCFVTRDDIQSLEIRHQWKLKALNEKQQKIIQNCTNSLKLELIYYFEDLFI